MYMIRNNKFLFYLQTDPAISGVDKRGQSISRILHRQRSRQNISSRATDRAVRYSQGTR